MSNKIVALNVGAIKVNDLKHIMRVTQLDFNQI